ncbi:activator-dependent family glycosyltransferase [Streptomyces phaeolivaceus]|uniref:Activator-dependent family glycosyltransferase n=1 Tax=Streptomyces phaeolivaceus TaxID=2653200 RepID=A0A5P8K9X2_9ACTN|nr:activator-dependent family glycosyltransferase [Streptomyces phaeolivaceus]QFQ99417.1 activator-dependent family glycosyltransferase [Streptomyces phaeolivaceus]
MRILFTVNPGKSIFLSMVPLAWALRTAGHEVRFASRPAFSDEITQAGLTATPVGRDFDLSRVLEWAGKDMFEEARADLPAPWDVVNAPADATWDHLLEGYARTVEEVEKPENFPIVAGLVEFARHWEPDLVIWEPFSCAGAIAAKACGAAHARIMWGIDVFGVAREHFLRLKAQQPADRQADPLADWLGAYARKYGGEFTEDMVTGHFTVDQFPRSLQLEAVGLDYERMQYIPYNGSATVPKWLWQTPDRPRVALTMGLTATDIFDGYTINTQDVLDSLADLDIEVVATIADSEKEKLHRIPDNARLLPFVPLHALAPTCSAVIHHAGPGTLATVARYGVPQVSIPYSFDEPIFARKLAERGAGLDMAHGEPTGRAIREAVLRLLNDPAFRAGAAALRDEIDDLPTPNQLVGRLEELTARHRTRV